MAFLLIQNNRVQNFLAQKTAKELSKFFGTRATVGAVGMDMLNRLVLKNFYIEDLRHDTLLYADKLTFSVHAINISKKIIKIDKLELKQAFINFFIDSTKTINLQFIIKKLSGDTSKTKPGWNVAFNNIGLIDSKFFLRNQLYNRKDTGINFKNLRIDHLNIRIKNLITQNRITSFKINKLSFREQTGFTLNNLSTKMSLMRNFMHFDDVRIITEYSNIKAPKIYFDFISFKDFSNFAQNVNVNYVFKPSKGSFSDIAYFVPVLWGTRHSFEYSGFAKGKISDLRCRQLNVKFGNSSLFNGNVSLTGLPEFKETFIYIDAKDFMVLPSDIENIHIRNRNGNILKIPKILYKAGLIGFKGNFTGYINDFVTYGIFKTEMGVIKTDFSLKPESKTRISFNGKLTAVDFNVGKLFDRENVLGNANLNMVANGIIEDNEKVTGEFDGKVNNLNFYGYTYSDILLKGSLQENDFKGSLILEDPNVKFSLFGQFDFSKEIPEFDFTANLNNAELHKLKIVKTDSIFNISCSLDAKFKGNNVDNIEGDIKLKNAYLQRLDKTILITDLSVNSHKNKMIVKSDIVDANISGAYNFKYLVPSLIKVFRKYMPGSFHRFHLDEEKLALNKFKFDIVLKNTNSVCDFFANGINLARNSRLTGSYYPPDSTISFEFNSDFFQSGATRFEGLNIGCNAQKDSLLIVLKSNKVYNGSQINSGKVMAKSVIYSDSMFTKIEWYNKDTIHSQVNMLANFFRTSPDGHPALNVRLFPADVYFIDSIWKFNETVMIIDTSSLNINGFKLSHNRQEFCLNGKISENPADTMIFRFKNFDLKNIGILIKNDRFLFNGKINGNADLTDVYNKSHFIAALNIDSFSINNEMLGKTSINIAWDNLQQKITTSADAYKSDVHTLHVEGEYTPLNKELDFNLDINNIGLSLFQPLLSNTFTLQKGKGTGNLTLTGNIYKPLLNGSIDINNARFMINYLRTIYNFDTKLNIQNNKFILSNIKMTDKNKNQATVNGFISNKYLKDFYLNIKINLDNSMVLNTNSKNNPSYYGNAFASGIVNIYGPVNSINIDMHELVTDKNTVIYIPLIKKADIAENNFLIFTSQQEKSVKEISLNTFQNEINPAGISLNLNLEITPDAEVQLVFDPKIGDIMRSQGQGNIKIEINPANGFNIRGDYTIESGDYLFTLQNLINKKFILEPGGVISWNGNPTDANIDIEALYHMKASLYTLFVDQTTPEYKKRIPVDCRLFLKGKLINPDIKYDIYLPNTSEEIRNRVKDGINNEEELSKQFLMLLVTNNFLPIQSSTGTVNPLPTTTGSTIGKNIATTTSYELMSNQFSNWISQVSKDFDIGFTYRPGEKNITSEEVEVALSTQLLNDRVNINGNFDVLGNQVDKTNQKSNTNNIVGDVNVDVKLTESGKLRLKAFNRVNDQLITDQALYTQGVGLLYREEFSTFGELMRYYYYKLFSKKDHNFFYHNADTTNRSKNNK